MARSAQPGHVVGLTTPTGMYNPPRDLRWQVLLADQAGLPALARILEQTPRAVPSRVVVEVTGPAHQLPLAVRPGTDLTWVAGGNGLEPRRIEEIVRTMPLPRDVGGYVWVAGESRALRGVRSYLRRELGLPFTAYKAIGYWTDRAEEQKARYDALDDATKAELEALWREDRPEDEIEVDYDDRLSALNL